jgi:hypothetical protein
MFLHEIAHTCGRTLGLVHDDFVGHHGDCDYARRISAIFGWAVAERWKRRGWDVGYEIDSNGGVDGCADYDSDDFCDADGMRWPRYGGC